MTADQLIQELDLKPHPEGGYYRESYRSEGVLPGSKKVFSTAIYFLLKKGDISKFHRLVSDEVFHFYLGDPVHWILIFPSGKIEKVTIGPGLGGGQRPQMVVKAGTWFGGYLDGDGAYALMGTTVAPGFEFGDFQLAKREELLREFPQVETEILMLT